MQDLLFSLRALRRNPAPAVVAVVVLALGMGANTAMFSVVNAVLLNSAPLKSLREPDRLVMLWEKNPAMMEMIANRMPVALENLRAWKAGAQSFEQISGFLPRECAIATPGAEARPAKVECGAVEHGFFRLLGVEPAVGRNFTPSEVKTTVLMSAAAYKARFGNDTNLTGKTLRIDGIDRAVIGVMPESFALPGTYEGTEQKKPEVWLPLDLMAAQGDEALWGRSYSVYGRLKPGATLAQARAEMNVMAARLEKEHPDRNHGFGVNVFPVTVEDVGPELRQGILVLQAAVGFVLLIACANMANLLLARAISREREIGIRLALGAQRSRIVRLMLTESLLLSVLGGLLGLLLAYWSLDLISALAPKDTHGFHELRLDPWVLLFTLGISVATGVLFGLAPAWHAARRDLTEPMGRGGRTASSGPQWLRNTMVAGEVALALVLLIGAGLMIRTLSHLMHVDPGFQPARLLTLRIEDVNVKDFGRQLLDRVGQLPGVESASISSTMPMQRVEQTNYRMETDDPKSKDLHMTCRSAVSETFFQTMGIAVRSGRGFTRQEAEAKEPTAIVVSESFAALNWPHQDPLGRTVLLPSSGKDVRTTVVGVVGDTHQMGPDSTVLPEMYTPSRQFTNLMLAVRTRSDTGTMKATLERAVWSIDPRQPLQPARSMEQVLYEWPANRRFYMAILAAFAGLALLLAALGLYGVLSYVVNLRTSELGVRIALGATTRDILSLVLRQGLALTLVGTAAGLAVALLVTRLMQSLLYGVKPLDPGTFAAVPAVLVVVALAACYLPARRAARVDPIQALRSE
ncbi:ABC transporter permease [uncultured Paludibaculum sp.]|uniref:ABC transporter permease n=1 Tax=uncultured Paludibaculum sp. TaxID=1765020 RepID=UPI002AAB9F89|nr:ABC transporter permease [uncultured Paludibaculum sp.]